MSNIQNDLIEDQIREAHEEAGLIFAERNDDGEPQWIGTDKQWRKFNLLTQ